MKALLYCRVSTKGQEDKTSLDAQAKACAKFAKGKKFQTVETIREVYSGADLHDRPELDRIRARFRNREADALICYSIDRLSRDVAHLAILTDEFERAGVELLFVTEDLDKSPEGKLLRSIKGYVGEIERIKIRERTQQGKTDKLKNGQLALAGPDLFGYRKNKETGKREIIQSEAKIIRRIFALCAKGNSAAAIANQLQAEQIPTPNMLRGKTAKGWHPHTIIKILRRPEYKGQAFANQYKIEKRKNQNGQLYKHQITRPESEWLSLPDTTPAIVAGHLWEQAQTQLDTNAGDRTRNRKEFWLLRGMVWCEKDGLKLNPVTPRAGYRYYYCRHHASYETGRCRLMLNADELENTVWEKIKGFLLQPKVIDQAERKSEQTSGPDLVREEIKSLETHLARLNTARDRLLNLLKATDDETLAKSAQAQLLKDAKRRKEVEQTLETLRAQRDMKQTRDDQWKSFQSQFESQLKRIERLTLAEKRELLERLQIRITIKPDKRFALQIDLIAKFAVSSPILRNRSQNAIIVLGGP